MNKNEKIRILEARIEELEQPPYNTKESIVKRIAKELGENPHKEKSYQDGDEIKTYNSMTDFYWGIHMMKRSILLELLEKLRNLNEEFAKRDLSEVKK